tara:strand:- start:135 stop:725 length:591 start_codon:yes stop_codon:yes gene_type:complete
MISQNQFNFIKSKYQYWSSWAIWADQGDTPKSNVGDLSVLDPNTNPKLLPTLNPNIVLVALNISRGDITLPFGNFHDARSEATDYKIRYATNDTHLWGAYMTDIIKDFEEKISGKVKSYLRENRDFEKENVDFFVQELSDIGATNPTLIAFGNESYDILKRNLNNEFKIHKIPHYANYSSKEKYRQQIKEVMEVSL